MPRINSPLHTDNSIFAHSSSKPLLMSHLSSPLYVSAHDYQDDGEETVQTDRPAPFLAEYTHEQTTCGASVSARSAVHERHGDQSHVSMQNNGSYVDDSKETRWAHTTSHDSPEDRQTRHQSDSETDHIVARVQGEVRSLKRSESESESEACTCNSSSSSSDGVGCLAHRKHHDLPASTSAFGANCHVHDRSGGSTGQIDTSSVDRLADGGRFCNASDTYRGKCAECGSAIFRQKYDPLSRESHADGQGNKYLGYMYVYNDDDDNNNNNNRDVPGHNDRKRLIF
jgi:hypothetical protein